MATTEKSSGFQKAGECLYRYVPTGTYYAVVRHQGKLIRRSLDTQDKAEAKRLLGDFRRSLEKVNFKANRCTLRELTKRYLDTVKFQAAKTFEAKELAMRHVQTDWPGGCDGQVKDVRSSDVKTWLSAQKERMGKSSFNGYIQTIRALFALAVEDRLIATSPAAGIKQLKRDTPIRESPTWEEFHMIVQDIRCQRFSAEANDSADFVEFLGLAGLGNAEAASLKWRDVDWQAGRIRVLRHKTDQGFLIPIYPQLRPLLERLKGEGNPPIDDEVLKIKNAKKSMAAACKRLGFPNFSHRSLRRMFITRAIERGVDVKVIAEWGCDCN